MSPYHLPLGLMLVLLSWSPSPARGDDDDEDVKGPLLPLKPDGALFTTAEIIAKHRHTAELHQVTTDDGYVLSVFRVVPSEPSKETAPAVLLQHGFLMSSDCWVTDSDALAFKLSDAGYDVWISNVRGNAYSRTHTKLKPEDPEFWNFSWHEMGTKDMPAIINYILQKTGNKKLHYIGHSMGCTISYVLTSVRPEYNEKLKSLTCFAPVAFLSKLNEMLGPDGMVEEYGTKYMAQFKESKKVEVFPRKDLPTNNQSQITCEDIEESFRSMCTEKMEEAQQILGGPYLPAGQSFKSMDHLYQIGVAGQMKYYRYDDPAENKKAYGSEDPPLYTDKFKLITAPVLLWSSDADQLVMVEDVNKTVSLLPNVVADNRIKDIDCFDHIAFMFPRKKGCIPIRAAFYERVIVAITKLDKN